MLVKLRFRFRFSEILLGFLLAVAMFAVGMTFQSSRHSNEQSSSSTVSMQADHKPDPFTRDWLMADGAAFFTGALVFVAAIQAGLFVWQLILLKRTLGPAEEAANAAKLNAEAVMVAEAAQMYLIVDHSNIEQLYTLGRFYNNSPTMHPSPSEPPWIEYRLRNYGKSPAIVQSVLHGIWIEDIGAIGTLREYTLGQEAMEIVGVSEQGQVIRCNLDGPFTFGDVRSVVTGDCLLCFKGQASFMDHFGRSQTLEWELVADGGRWNLISHRNTRSNLA